MEFKKVENFVSSNKYLIGFVAASLIVNLVFGEKVLFYFLALVFLSMLLVNSDKIKKFVGGLKV